MSYQRVDPNSDMALMQQSGIGAYNQVGDWSFELFPYAYSFEAPADSRPIPPPILGGKGMGCGCGCSKNQGLGQGLFNTGLFESANPSTWGLGEWATLGIGLYLAGSLISDVSRGAKAGAAAGAKVGKKYSRKAVKAAKSTSGLALGGIVAVLIVVAGGFAFYEYSQSQTATTAAAQ